ncbi:MAG TPA: OsmC family protein [Casimicrobiaceae bacterium]|nr:OsmC family protein [Casimicrobiaceae bacterium]
MLIEARIESRRQSHAVVLATDGSSRTLSIAPRDGGPGSSVNGGELLCLALATCYCNDLYREAARRGIAVVRVAVEARAQFDASGEPARSLGYRADVVACATEDEIRELMMHTDRVAEVQATLRRGMAVRFDMGIAQREA